MSQDGHKQSTETHLNPMYPGKHRRVSKRALFWAAFIPILLLNSLLADWTFLSPKAFAALPVSQSAQGTNTFQQFLKNSQTNITSRGPSIPQWPLLNSQSSLRQGTSQGIPQKLLPSAEPPTMQPISLVLDSTLTASTMVKAAGILPANLKGSDGRLEVQIPAGSLDVSRAVNANGVAANGSLTLKISHIQGNSIGALNMLGAYQIQIVDSQGQVINGVKLRTPITFTYHYRPAEIKALQLNPDHLFMSWPGLLTTARARHQSTANLAIPLTNYSQAHTLTAQSLVLTSGSVTVGVGYQNDQSPPKPNFVWEQGNTGNVGYTYPIQIAPGPGGFVPDLALTYSTAVPNNQHGWGQPSGDVGEGWNIGLGSVTSSMINGTTYYSISGIAGVNDLLLPIPGQAGFYETEHISHLRIQQVTVSNQPCFHIWDTSSTYYELGCTSDSLQYYTTSSGRTNYRWDLDTEMAAAQGPNTPQRHINVHYLQDITTANNLTSVRDASIEQVQYGVLSADGKTFTPSGTVDFLYRAPAASSSANGLGQAWGTAYGNNFACDTTTFPLLASTTLRCDDPIQDGSVPPPIVMSTMMLQTIETFVGDDSSATHLDYKYTLGYDDLPFVGCNDPFALIAEFCPNNLLLTSITPIPFLQGTSQHPLHPVSFGYQELDNTYIDTTQKVLDNLTLYQVQTRWRYLTTYYDGNTGIGQNITYTRAWDNTHGTPNALLQIGIPNPPIVDDRHDPFFCETYKSTQYACTGAYANPNDRVWTVEAVSQIQISGKDSSATSISPATTTYSYRMAVTNNDCPAAGSDTDCVGYTWLPPNDNSWQNYYDGRFMGFAAVSITSPSGDLTVQHYTGTNRWGSADNDPINYLSNSLLDEEVYQGTNTSPFALLRQTTNTYAGENGTNTHTSCDASVTGTYLPCEVVLLSTRTTTSEGQGSNGAPWIEHDYTYDDYTTSGGLQTGTGHYHNTLTEKISGSNLPSSVYPVTKSWQYLPVDQTVSNFVYYVVDKVGTSNVVDASGHGWNCQSFFYDGGNFPVAGWVTTSQVDPECSRPTPPFHPLIANNTSYDSVGNVVATVDGVGIANPGLYASHGCTLATPPAIGPSSTPYTTCTTYDSYSAQPTSVTNALGQTTTVTYDPSQQDWPVSVTDPNNQTTTTAYSYDGNGNLTVQRKQPLETASYTIQSTENSNCSSTLPSSTTLPCFEVDKNTSLYSSAVSRTFYDAQGRAVETRTPGPTPGDDTVVMTVYNDGAHTVWQSLPFEVTAGSGWLDPNGAKNINNNAPTGTTTFYDALGRVIATQDPNVGSSQEPGIVCNGAGITTTCTIYSVGLATGDTNSYVEVTTTDANSHVNQGFSDVLGNMRYTQAYQGISHPTSYQRLGFNGTNDGNWNNVQSLTLTVNLSIGNNTILFSNPNGWSPDIDKITVNGASYEAEAAGNTLSGGAVVSTSCSACSGGKDVGFIGNGGTLQFNNVNVPSTGSYPLTISYVNGGGGRSANIDINDLTVLKQTQTQYNALNKPTSISVTDQQPQSGQSPTTVVTTMTYDDIGRLLTLNDPDQGGFSYMYDADSRVTEVVQGARITGMNYDLLGRVGCVQTSFPTPNWNGACSAGNPLLQNTYDATKLGTQGSTDFPVGRLTQSIATTYFPDSTSATVTQLAQTDQRGRTVTAQMQIGVPAGWNVSTGLPTYQLTQLYNDANQPTTTGASAGSQSYTFSQVYDPNNGSLQGLSNNSGSTANLAQLTYNEFAQLGSLTLLNGASSSPASLASETFNYDANLRPLSLSANWLPGSGNSGQILNQGRSYDSVGNVVSSNTTFAAVPGNSGSGGTEVQNFCYDEQNRLIWSGNGGVQPGAGNGTCGSGTLNNTLNGANYINPYVYTNLGQIWQGPLNGQGNMQQYLYCNSQPHELTGIYPIGTTCANKGSATAVYSASYDAYGNMTSRTYNNVTATLSYDQFNRLVQWNAGSNSQEWYIYDASGNRVLKRSISGSTTSLTVYAFGLQELSYNGSGVATGQIDYYSLAGRLIGSTDGTNTIYDLTDAQGSVLMTLNSTAVVGEQAYGPYGNQRYTQGTIGTDKGYTGQFHDSVTGLDYYNARYYDPVVGRFLSPDDVQGNAQAMDPYAYVNGNPETLTDPTGKKVACGPDGCGSGGPPNQNDCNADPSLSGCPGGGGPPAGGGSSGGTTKQTTGECAGLTSAQCNQAKAKVKNVHDQTAFKIKLVGLVGSLASLVLHAIPFGADLLSLFKLGGFTLKKLWETLGEGIPVFLDLTAVISQIIAITGMNSLKWIVDAVAGIANALSSAYSAIKGLLDNKWISALADAGGFIAEGVVTLFTGGGSAALTTALSTLADGVWNKLKQQWSKEAFGAAGSVASSGIAAWTNFIQMQQDRCDNMSLAQVYAQGC